MTIRTRTIDPADQGTGPTATPALVVLLEAGRPGLGSSRHVLGGVDTVAIGRGAARSYERDGRGLRIALPDPSMSTTHARLERSFDHWVVRDAGSKNGTFVDGERITEHVLVAGATIELGGSFLTLVEDVPATSPALDHDLAPVGGVLGLPTLDPELHAALVQLERVAGAPLNLVLQGATGSGKEVLARAIHAASRRRGTFAGLNCAAIPANLVESELFGVRKGAFSGAPADRIGWVQAADHGTLFLDEIGDLPLPAQAALLRVLQEREVTPVGGTSPIAVEVRVVAATHRDLDLLVRKELFRADLLARLAGFRFTIPALAARTVDLGILIARLWGRHAPDGHPGMTPAAARQLLGYGWPSNVRELEQALVAALALSAGQPIAVTHWPEPVRTAPPRGAKPDDLEATLRLALARHGGNVSAVARELDKDRRQIQRWLARFGLDPKAFE